MTREEIIRMARSDDWAVDVSLKWDDFFVRFANLVAAAEREECAKVCDVVIPNDEYATALINSYADAIRSKGQ